MKVLVVDDNRLLSETIQETLKNKGLKVISARDGLDGYSSKDRKASSGSLDRHTQTGGD
jgi:DNA-binding response OmpR family regulator